MDERDGAAVLDGDAFRLAGGTGGVNDVSQIAGGGFRGPGGFRLRVLRCIWGVEADDSKTGNIEFQAGPKRILRQ